MGLDLRLLVAHGAKSEVAFTIIECVREENGFFELVNEFQEQQGHDGEIRSYHSEDAWVDYDTDAYGYDLRYVLSEDLERVFRVSKDVINRGVRAYIKEINPKTRIFLYWH